MRNLLLVKTSEDPEEAIDVSSENMKLLKEESTMLDVETLMRYIRIFSDLSNQIRYATQKRVLVEIALIKLCRPAMETNLDSVLDRLRVLEQRRFAENRGWLESDHRTDNGDVQTDASEICSEV